MDENSSSYSSSSHHDTAVSKLESYHDHRHDHVISSSSSNDGTEEDNGTAAFAPVEVDEDDDASSSIAARLLLPTTTTASFSFSSLSTVLSSLQQYFLRVIKALSVRYFVFLLLTQIGICGIYSSIIGASFLPLFQALGVEAATEQLLVLVCLLPYTAAPLLGVISDVLPLGGYHKKYWMIIAILLGSVGSTLLTTRRTPTTTDDNTSNHNDVVRVVGGLVLMNLELAVINLLNEGKYSEVIRQHPAVAADIMTFQQGCSALGSLLAMSFVGPLTDAGHSKLLFQLAGVVGLFPLLPLFGNWLPEEKRTFEKITTTATTTTTTNDEDTTNFTNSTTTDRRSNSTSPPLKVGCTCLAFDVDRLVQQRSTVGIALLVGILGPILAVVSAYWSRTVGLVAVTLVLLVVWALACRLLPRQIANLVGYTILTRASSPSLRSALQYFYTASPECLPDGPHFSYTYYLTYNGIIGELFMLTAIIVYQAYLSHWSYRSVLFFTLVLSCGSRFVDVALVLRWNITVLGIPDALFFVLGSSMFESLTSMLHLMPFGAIVGKLCPRGTETATFAFIAGVSSFSTTLGSLLGSAMMDAVGLKTTLRHTNTTHITNHTTTALTVDDEGSSSSSSNDEPLEQHCDFTSLPLLIVGLAIILPIVVGVPAIQLLIPDALQSEGLVPESGWQELNQDDDEDRDDEDEDCEDSERPSEVNNVELGGNNTHQLC